MDEITKLQKYMQTPAAKNKSSAAKDKAWPRFVKQFPNADVTKSVLRVSIDKNNNFCAEVFFSKQALTFCRACLAMPENIGTSK